MTLPDRMGYVLAGGRSSRMGRDKATLRLGGRQLLDIAVDKLGSVCAEVAVVGERDETVPVRNVGDLRVGCGPMGGIEAALTDLRTNWAVFLPVDMPFLPVKLLFSLVESWTAGDKGKRRVCLLEVEGTPQPLVSMLHKEMLPWMASSLERGEYKVVPALLGAAREIAEANRWDLADVLRVSEFDGARVKGLGWEPTEADLQVRQLWFANLNTPEEFAEAERFAGDGIAGGVAASDEGEVQGQMEEQKADVTEEPTVAGTAADGEAPVAESSPVVEEFMEQAAQQNEAAAEEIPDVRNKPGSYISFEKVCKSFGDFVVLEDVSFCVNAGETLCILGRSGVGKSVSLQMLLGFLKPDKGIIRVAGEDITGFSERELQKIRQKVTMVFQNGALFDSITVGENVAFPLRERKDMEEDQIHQVVNGLLEMAGVAGMADLLPSDLSTGMKRSVAIARALASQPEAVLYDEPTTMVDPMMAHLLGNLIERLKQQLHLTSIVVTHDMRFAKKLADRVVFLHQGRAHFFGTMEEMEKSDDPILQEFLTLDELVLPV